MFGICVFVPFLLGMLTGLYWLFRGGWYLLGKLLEFWNVR